MRAVASTRSYAFSSVFSCSSLASSLFSSSSSISSRESSSGVAKGSSSSFGVGGADRAEFGMNSGMLSLREKMLESELNAWMDEAFIVYFYLELDIVGVSA